MTPTQVGGNPAHIGAAHDVIQVGRDHVFGLGRAALRGPGCQAEDMVTSDLDNAAGSSYMGRVASYLGGGHTTDLEKHAYVAALWWSLFFAEQVGTEPQ